MGLVRTIGLALAEPAPRAFGAAIVIIELGLSVLVLSRGRAARLGLLGVASFLVGITPLGVYTVANPLLAVGAIYLATLDWPTAAFARAPRSRQEHRATSTSSR